MVFQLTCVLIDGVPLCTSGLKAHRGFHLVSCGFCAARLRAALPSGGSQTHLCVWALNHHHHRHHHLAQESAAYFLLQANVADVQARDDNVLSSGWSWLGDDFHYRFVVSTVIVTISLQLSFWFKACLEPVVFVAPPSLAWSASRLPVSALPLLRVLPQAGALWASPRFALPLPCVLPRAGASRVQLCAPSSPLRGWGPRVPSSVAAADAAVLAD